MTNVIAIDTGLATFGAVVFSAKLREDHTPRSWCRHVEVFTSDTRAEKWSLGMVDDVTRRGRELAQWFERLVIQWSPKLILSEKMGVFAHSRSGGIENIYVQILNSVAWGVVIAEVQRRLIKFSSVVATTCRKAVCGKSDEALAQTVAMRRYPDFAERDARLRADMKPHARDALCVYDWGVISGLVAGVCR